jgi:hypothetical protein
MHPIGGPPAQDAAPKSNRPIYDHPALSFDEYMRLNPTSVGRNHYKGDMVYANFGYFLVDGKWVDPESEGALFDAYIGRSNDSNPELPHLNRSRDSGSYVMKQEEQDEFYREFVEDVTDEIDGEGDPRVYRITPAIFARWATGAVEGEKFEETVMEPQVRIYLCGFTLCLQWFFNLYSVNLELDRQKFRPHPRAPEATASGGYPDQ